MSQHSVYSIIEGMGKKSRDKGKRGERQISRKLTRLSGIEARRGVQYKGTPDSPDVIWIDGLHIESKYDSMTAGKTLYKAVAQAKEDAGENDVPVVITRRNREKWLVVFELDDLIDLGKILCNQLDLEGG